MSSSMGYVRSSPMFNSTSPIGSSVSTRHSDNGRIFSREMTIYVKNNDSSTSSIASQDTMLLLVEINSRFHEHRKTFDIQIENRDDPFFVFTYIIDSNEFDKLKRSKSLTTSFESFPENLKNLLGKCATNNDDNKSYMLCMNIHRTELQLDIIERNEISNSVLISLIIPAANEEFIRSRFIDNYRKLCRENEDLHETIKSMENDFRSLTVTKSQDVQRMSEDLAGQKHYFDEKIREMDRTTKEEKEQLLESERNLKSEVNKLQFELRNKEKQLDKERQDSKRKYTELKEKYVQELSKKDFRIKEVDDRNKQLNSEQEYQKNLREKTSHVLKKNELELDVAKKDLSKANEIIRKLQEEVKSSRDKLGILNQVTHKQEEIVGIKESTVERLASDLKACLQQLKTKDKEIIRLENELERCRSNCSQSELQIGANKSIIAKLSKKIAEMKEAAKKQTEYGERIVTQAETTSSATNCPVLKSQHNLDRNGKSVAHLNKQTIEREITRKKSSTIPSKPQISSKNVDFLVDDRQISNGKTRINLNDDLSNDIHLLLNNDSNLKNHLFTHIKEKPQLREVNLRTNHKTKSGPTSSNVISSRRTHMF